MAKKLTVDKGMFESTEPKTTDKMIQPEEVKNTPVSVYLTAEEKIKIGDIAKELKQTNHYVMQFAIRDFLKRYEAGEYSTQTETKKTLTSE
jgi:hypothetical protein